jgi:uncharacterized membrane protein
MLKWEPKDVIAVIVVIGCFTLLGLGKDSYISWALLGIVGTYYGIDLTPFIKLGRKQKKD